MQTSTYTTLGLAIAFVLQGCAVPSAPSPAQAVAQPPPQQQTCNASGAQFAVGQAWNTPLGETARQRAGADSVRALWPNQMVTMEFSASRLNLELDAADRITRVRCG